MNVLIDEEQIRLQIERTAAEVSRRYRGRPLLMVGILTGSFIFVADFVRALDIPCEVCFMAASSYGDSDVSSGDVKITRDIDRDLSKYDVIILEDIVDTGRTLARITEMLKERHPLSLAVITLLDKPARREADLEPDVSLFTIPDLFVVGYGLDYAEKYRQLLYIGGMDS